MKLRKGAAVIIAAIISITGVFSATAFAAADYQTYRQEAETTETAADGGEYIPLRKTFEEMGCTVSWTKESPDKVLVNMGDYAITFRDGSEIISVDEGKFTLSADAYMENGITYMPSDSVELCNNLYLYHNAIIDASVAEEDELLPLKAIDTSEESVLVCTWNRYPETYVNGADITISYGDVWVFTEEEILEWGQKNDIEENMTLRMEQLIGLPPQKGYTHFSVLRVKTEDLYRPARDNEIDDTTAQLTFPEDATEEYMAWFAENAEYSYNPHRYPWTGLGYTYDWADNGTEYGLSEFILKNGAEVTVERTYTNEEFFEYITKPQN